MNINKTSTPVLIALAITGLTACSSQGDGGFKYFKNLDSSVSEIILVQSDSDIDPSIPLNKKDKVWLKVKNEKSLISSFDKSGNPKIIYKKSIVNIIGEKASIEELNAFNAYKNSNIDNNFNNNKINIEITNNKINWNTFNTNIKYRIDVMDGIKEDSMTLKPYPSYSSYIKNDSYTSKKSKYTIISKINMKDKTNIFVIHRVK